MSVEAPERQMVCSQHRPFWPDTTRPSDPEHPFFRAQPEAEYDLYYCGCWGYD